MLESASVPANFSVRHDNQNPGCVHYQKLMRSLEIYYQNTLKYFLPDLNKARF